MTNDPDSVARALARLLPEQAAVVVACKAHYAAPLWAGEEVAVARATATRREEFAAGRACAREALRALGLAPRPLPADASRAPAWPRGVIGSISHCRGFCGAVVTRTDVALSLGLDAEPLDAVDGDLDAILFSDVEREHLANLGPGRGWRTLGFSAKEAFYKAYSPLWRTFLDFRDVEVRLTPGASRTQGRFEVLMTTAQAPAPTRGGAGGWFVAEDRIHATFVFS